jgi:type I restriction enzyme S subunit
MNMDEQQLPPGWVEAKLEDVFEVCDNLREPVNADERAQRIGSYPYYGANGQAGTIDDFRYDGDFVLLAEDGGYFDEPSRGVAYRASGKFWVNNHAHVLRPLGEIPVLFSVHALNSMDWMPYVSGTTRLKLNQAKMRGATLQIPPLAEQRRIVAKIEALQERSGRAAKALEEVGPLLEQFRQSILAAAFSGRLTADWREKNPNVDSAQELASVNASVVMKTSEHATGLDLVTKLCPDHWAIAELGEVFTFIDYRGRNPEKAATGRRLITAKNIRMGFIQDDPVEYVSEDTYREWMTRGFPEKGDLLFVTEGHTMGYVAMNERDDSFALAQRTITLHPPAGVNSQCFLYFLMSPVFQLLVKENATGSAAQGVKGARLRGFPVPFPSFAEQSEIVRRVQSLFAYLVATEAVVHYGKHALPQLNQSILAKAFRGELVPQDPNDEPASELLARIRREREGSVDRVQGSGRKKKARRKGTATVSAPPAKQSKRSSTAASATTPDASTDPSPEPARPRRRRRRSSSNDADASLVIRVLAEGGCANIHADTSGPVVQFYTKSSGGGLLAEIEDIPESALQPRESQRVATLRDIMEPDLALLHPVDVNETYLPQLRDWYTWAAPQLPEHIKQDFLQRAQERWVNALELSDFPGKVDKQRRPKTGRLFENE